MQVTEACVGATVRHARFGRGTVVKLGRPVARPGRPYRYVVVKFKAWKDEQQCSTEDLELTQ